MARAVIIYQFASVAELSRLAEGRAAGRQHNRRARERVGALQRRHHAVHQQAILHCLAAADDRADDRPNAGHVQDQRRPLFGQGHGHVTVELRRLRGAALQAAPDGRRHHR